MPLKLKITNRTMYKTHQLRKLIRAGILEDSGPDAPGRVKPYSVGVKYARGITEGHGLAYFKTREMHLWLPRGAARAQTVQQLTVHETGHLRDLTHKEMPKWFQLQVRKPKGVPKVLHDRIR